MQPSAVPWPLGLLTASSSGFLSCEKVTTPVKNCPGKIKKTNVYSLNLLGILLLIITISMKIAFYDTSLHHPRSRPDSSTSTSFFLASIWWQMKTEGGKHLPVCYRYSNIVLHNYSSIFILSQHITFNKQQVTDFIPYQSSCCREIFRHFSEQSACSDIPDLQWFVFKYYS